jgi:hypothetical protein
MAANTSAAAPVASAGLIVERRDMIDSLNVGFHLLAMSYGMEVSLGR